MKSKELNLNLISVFPEIKELYEEETSWQEGDETGSHIVFEDVFVPYIKLQIKDKNKENLQKIFEFLENLLELNDSYTDEVVAFSVIESLIFDEEIEEALWVKYAKKKTLGVIAEITEGMR